MDNVATGPTRLFVQTNTETKTVNQQRQPSLPIVNLTEPRHKAAAERLEKDEYKNCCEILCLHEFNGESQDPTYELAENSKLVSVKGRLRSHVSFWESIRAPQFIIDTISRGYIIPLF